jgi:hypothetical protein
VSVAVAAEQLHWSEFARRQCGVKAEQLAKGAAACVGGGALGRGGGRARGGGGKGVG